MGQLVPIHFTGYQETNSARTRAVVYPTMSTLRDPLPPVRPHIIKDPQPPSAAGKHRLKDMSLERMSHILSINTTSLGESLKWVRTLRVQSLITIYLEQPFVSEVVLVCPPLCHT